MIMDDNEDTNPLEMSDEDFLKTNPPTDKEIKKVEEPSAEKQEVTPVVTEEEKEKTTSEDNKEIIKEEDKSKKEPEQKQEPEWKEYIADPDKTDQENADLKAEHDKTKPAEKTTEDDEKNPDGTPKVKSEAAPVEAKPIDYEGFYKEIMKPFKANGREIKLNTPEEAIRLMQMGAGYGRKLQDLQPHLKTIRMLEKNNILDPTKISFLIDINNKNPEAIKKLVKDSGIDPLDLNTNDAVTYRPTNHSVSDSEMSFQNALQETLLAPGGQDTIKEINTKWDPKSKQALWESPKILEVIQSQRENGIYDQINAEIDRQKLLGQIAPTTPFLESYKIAGDYLTANKLFKLPSSSIPAVTEAPKEQVVLETRTASVKSEVSNSDKAKAAAPTQATSRKASEIKNPLEMPDDEFMKQFQGRL